MTEEIIESETNNTIINYEIKDLEGNIIKTGKCKKIKTSQGIDFGHCTKCCFFDLYKCEPCCDAPFNDERFIGCYENGFIFENID